MGFCLTWPKCIDGFDLLKVSSSLVLKCSVKEPKMRKKSRKKGPPLLTQSFSLAIMQRTNVTRTNPGKPLAAPNATHMADWGRKVVMIGCGVAVITWICQFNVQHTSHSHLQ